MAMLMHHSKSKLFFLTILIFSIYLYSLPPSISIMDTAEFAWATHQLAIAHPPGYPLYILLGKIFQTIIPFATPAYRLNVCSAVLGTLTIAVVAAVIYSLTKDFAITVLISFSLALNRIFYFASVESEVFILQGLFSACMIAIAFQLMEPERYQFLSVNTVQLYTVLGLLIGFSVAHQHIFVFSTPAFAYVLVNERNKSLRAWLWMIGMSLLGATPYIYFPVRSAAHAPIAQPSIPVFSISDFFFFFFRRAYGTFQMHTGAQSISWSYNVILSTLKNTALLIYESSGISAVVLFIIGIISGLKTHRKTLSFLLIFMFGYIALAVMTKTGEDRLLLTLTSRYYLLVVIVFYMMAATGLSNKQHWLKTSLGCALILETICISFPRNIIRQDYFVRDFSKNILQTLPPHSIISTINSIEAVNYGIRYLQQAEHARSDALAISSAYQFRGSLPEYLLGIPVRDVLRELSETANVYIPLTDLVRCADPDLTAALNISAVGLLGMVRSDTNIVRTSADLNFLHSTSLFTELYQFHAFPRLSLPFKQIYSREADLKDCFFQTIFSALSTANGNLTVFRQQTFSLIKLLAIARFNRTDKMLAVVYVNEGNDLFKSGNPVSAIEKYRHAKLWNPKLIDIYLNWGFVEMELKHVTAARGLWETALKLNPSDPRPKKLLERLPKPT